MSNHSSSDSPAGSGFTPQSASVSASGFAAYAAASQDTTRIMDGMEGDTRHRRRTGRRNFHPVRVSFGSSWYQPRLPDPTSDPLIGPGTYPISRAITTLPMKKYERTISFTATSPRFSHPEVDPFRTRTIGPYPAVPEGDPCNRALKLVPALFAPVDDDPASLSATYPPPPIMIPHPTATAAGATHPASPTATSSTSSSSASPTAAAATLPRNTTPRARSAHSTRSLSPIRSPLRHRHSATAGPSSASASASSSRHAHPHPPASSSPPATSASSSGKESGGGGGGSGGSSSHFRTAAERRSAGLSSLLSRCERFPKNPQTMTTEREAFYTPGPGGYNPPAGGGVFGLRDGHPAPARPSAVFCSKSDRKTFTFSDGNSNNSLVGPGTYSPPARGAALPAPECQRPFRSITPRFVRTHYGF